LREEPKAAVAMKQLLELLLATGRVIVVDAVAAMETLPAASLAQAERVLEPALAKV
jgi:hypothetical protein